jgi:NitT/TauT family transport system permease protein
MASQAAANAAESAVRPGLTVGAVWLARPQRRALIAFLVALVAWQLGSTSGRWLGQDLPFIGRIPAPSTVFVTWSHLVFDPGYWQSWVASGKRVTAGFCAAVLTGVPLGLVMALSRPVWDLVAPVFELLRPIPPLAWVPAAIIFWPTHELSIDFVIFIGAFYTMVLNAVGGARSVDPRLLQVARSMGASGWNVLTRIVLPGVLPSVLVGMEVSIGITWEVVVAAEMISGGGSSHAAASGGGLGFFIWSSYVGGSYPQIVVGMISIGIAGYISSAALRSVAARLSRWNVAHGVGR